jgi:hypothetical protein
VKAPSPKATPSRLPHRSINSLFIAGTIPRPRCPIMPAPESRLPGATDRRLWDTLPPGRWRVHPKVLRARAPRCGRPITTHGEEPMARRAHARRPGRGVSDWVPKGPQRCPRRRRERPYRRVCICQAKVDQRTSWSQNDCSRSPVIQRRTPDIQ